MAHDYGKNGKLTCRWVYGIAVINKGVESTYTWSKDDFYIVEKPSDKINPGYPLNTISKNKKLNKYFTEITEEDKKKREVVDTRNSLDTSILNIEKTVKDNADKLSEEDKKQLTDACEEAKKHLQAESLDELKKASEDLMNVANTVFSKMYQQAQAQAQQAEQAGATPNGDKPKDDGDPNVVVE